MVDSLETSLTGNLADATKSVIVYSFQNDDRFCLDIKYSRGFEGIFMYYRKVIVLDGLIHVFLLPLFQTNALLGLG